MFPGLKCCPLMFPKKNPVRVCWVGAFTTYHGFSHLESRLPSGVGCTEVGYSNLIVGSDEEKALTKASQQCFPSSTLILCTLHLQDNLSRYKCIYRASVTSQNLEERLLAVTFWDVMGLLSANSVYDFDERYIQLSSAYHTTSTEFGQYFEKNLLPQTS